MKKIFFIVGSLGAGGSERVYWLLSQYFANRDYDVYVVFLTSQEQCFSTDIAGVTFIDLGTTRASKSFFKLLKVLRDAKPFAVFSTTDHINILTAIVSFFISVPRLLARVSNNPRQMKAFYGLKARLYNQLAPLLLHRYDKIICQTNEMRQVASKVYRLPAAKLKVIPNPVNDPSGNDRDTNIPANCQLIAVGRLRPEKGLFRLLEVMQLLPENYSLSIAGDGPLMEQLVGYAAENNLNNRVSFLGQVTDVAGLIQAHQLLVAASFTEGFPNAVLEALATGTPVVTFTVGGVTEMIKPGFNGYLIEQDNLHALKDAIITACSREWNRKAIQADALQRFSLDHIGRMYEDLL
jgi:glycosyltransferase involved in cell wall biosynthesis